MAKYYVNSIYYFTDRIYEKLLNKFGKTSYLKIIIINGQCLSIKFKKLLKTNFPSARFILYRHDSNFNRPFKKIDHEIFDHISSFDYKDCIDFGFSYRPLFFANEISTNNLKPKSKNYSYDFSFIGTIHTDRYTILKRLENSYSKSMRIFYYLYMKSKIIYYLLKVLKKDFRKSKINEFKFNTIPLDYVTKIQGLSNVIVDINHPMQSGLTMRTIEVIGSGGKLATTNYHIMQEDFYDPKRIFILSRENPQIPIDFFEETPKKLESKHLKKLSIKGFTEDLLSF